MNLTLVIAGAALMFGIIQIDSTTLHDDSRTFFNTSFVNVYTAKCIKRSRLELYLNFSYAMKVNVESDDDEQVKITGYQFRSNEYRKGPIEFKMGWCTALHSKEFDLPQILSISNLRSCPLHKDKMYYVYNVAPNATNMPPLIPEGRWMFEFKFTYQNKHEISRFEWYTTVEYPIKILG